MDHSEKNYEDVRGHIVQGHSQVKYWEEMRDKLIRHSPWKSKDLAFAFEITIRRVQQIRGSTAPKNMPEDLESIQAIAPKVIATAGQIKHPNSAAFAAKYDRANPDKEK